MFMKCFKKKLATGLLVVSVVCGISQSASAAEIVKREVLRDNFVKYTLDNGDYCYITEGSLSADKYGATSVSIALSMQCFQSKEIKNNKK